MEGNMILQERVEIYSITSHSEERRYFVVYSEDAQQRDQRYEVVRQNKFNLFVCTISYQERREGRSHTETLALCLAQLAQAEPSFPLPEQREIGFTAGMLVATLRTKYAHRNSGS